MLHKGKSKKAFEENVKTEMHHGHPLAQSLAIAYSMKRKSKKHHAHGGHAGHYAKGGEADPYAHHAAHDSAFEHEEEASGYLGHPGNDVKHNAAAIHEDDKLLNQHGEHETGPEGRHYAHGGFIGSHQTPEHEMDMVGKIMKQRQHAYAKGGHVGGMAGGAGRNKYQDQSEKQKGINKPHAAHSAYSKEHLGTSQAGEYTKDTYGGKPTFEAGPHHPAKKHHHEVLHELKSMPNPKLKGLAHGGAVHHYSKGGQVANDDHPFNYEFHTPDQFDDLVKRDDLEFHYTGANSGDHLGDAREDHDRHDIVSRIMKSRKKHDRMPHLK